MNKFWEWRRWEKFFRPRRTESPEPPNESGDRYRRDTYPVPDGSNYDDDTRLRYARQFVGVIPQASLSSTNRVNIPLIITSAAMIIGLPILWFKSMDSQVNSANATAEARATSYYATTHPPTRTPTRTPYPTIYYPPTYTPHPTTSPTPVVTIQPSLSVTLGYSYYYPALGGVNCHPDNWVNGVCTSVLFDKPWQDWLGKGIAMPPSLIGVYPLGAEVEAFVGGESIGIYIVVDVCPACDKDDGTLWVDFLDDTQRYPWYTPVTIERR